MEYTRGSAFTVSLAYATEYGTNFPEVEIFYVGLVSQDTAFVVETVDTAINLTDPPIIVEVLSETELSITISSSTSKRLPLGVLSIAVATDTDDVKTELPLVVIGEITRSYLIQIL